MWLKKSMKYQISEAKIWPSQKLVKMWQKVMVLLWKVYILRRRHFIITLLEVLVPIVLFWLVVHFRNLLPEKQEIITNLTSLSYSNMTRIGNYSIAFSPSNNFTTTLMKLASEKMEAQGCKVVLEPKETEEEVASWLKTEYVKDIKNKVRDYSFWVTSPKGMGVIFLDAENISSLTYTLRATRGDLKTNEDSLFGEKNGYGISSYQFSGFLTVQLAIDQSYLTAIQNVSISEKTQVMELPFVKYVAVDLIKMLMPTVLTLGFTFVMPSLLKEVVEERTSGIKEMMKIMGLRPWLNWLSWMVYSLVVYVPCTVVITMFLTVDSGTGCPVEANFLIVWTLFLLFTFALITLLFTFSTFFINGTIAMIVGELVWYGVTVLLNLCVVSNPDKFHISVQLLSCLWPSIALIWSFNTINNFQRAGRPWTLGNMFDDGTGGGRISVGLAVIMLLVDIVVYSFITWFMDQVKPGPFGRAKPLTFIFKCFKRKKKSSESVFLPNESQENYEAAPNNAEVGIKIENLYKTYCRGTLVAVENVNLDIYKGTITALLGHNGAGKTSLMSMLAGFFSPSRGQVIVKDKNIFDDMDQFRSNLGLCPQHNLLFSYFTVMEHLVFFGMLKGLTYSQAKEKGITLLKSLNIYERKNYTIARLSGGMKRKVSLAIALLGDPHVVLLDEPTSGMDPESRRQVWDMLLKLRGQRTTIFTTHFMEEADVLGDRIAIMNNGQVSCYGTPIFLKRLYGTGYQMHVSKQDQAPVPPIAQAVQKHITSATLRLISPTQMNFNIKADESPKFPDLFSDLDMRKVKLGLTDISINCTSMEDVFLRVVGDRKENSSTSCDIKALDLKITKVQGSALLLQRIKALVYKRLLIRIRYWISTLTYIVVPVALMAASMWQMMQQDYSPIQPLLQITLSSFPKVVVAVSLNNQTVTSIIENIVTSGEATYVTVPRAKDLESYMIEQLDNNLIQYERSMIAGFESQSGSLVGSYSQYFDHSLSLVLNIMANTLLRLNNRFANITIYNHPIAVFDTQDVCDLASEAFAHVADFPLKIIFLSLGLLILTMGFISFPLRERVLNFKQLQLMSGVSPLQYWLVIFLCDFVFCLITIVLMICIVLVFERDDIYSSTGYVGTVALILVLFGCSGTPFAYFFSFLVKSAVKANVAFAVFNMAFGVFGAIFIKILDGTYTYFGFWRFILSFNPLFSATSALLHLFTIMYIDGTCLQCGNQCTTMDPFNFIEPGPNTMNPHGINTFLIFLLVDGFIYFGLVLLIEYGIVKKVMFRISTLWIKHDESCFEDDHDVKLEKDCVLSYHKLGGLLRNMPILSVYNLGKKYNRKTTAVHRVTFQVVQGECFGLLGVNGAGKTTTFKMLTGEEIPNKGDAKIQQFSLTKNKSKYLSQIGYCPQFDPINTVLTCKEMLKVVALLRGIPTVQCNSEVSKWIQILGLQEYADRPCGTYSGGNKRKLSTAMAFIGAPPVVFLDEPTCGVDPVSRRRLWDIVTGCQKTGQAIVLTSHSMEECESLCSRLTIMVSGRMKCIGSPQYLKHKFGKGYTIKIKMNSSINRKFSLDALKEEMTILFSDCKIKDENLGLLHYHVPDPDGKLPLGKVFKAMEHLKTKYRILEDYIVSHATLEEVFMSFARQKDVELLALSSKVAVIK